MTSVVEIGLTDSFEIRIRSHLACSLFFSVEILKHRDTEGTDGGLGNDTLHGGDGDDTLDGDMRARMPLWDKLAMIRRLAVTAKTRLSAEQEMTRCSEACSTTFSSAASE